MSELVNFGEVGLVDRRGLLELPETMVLVLSGTWSDKAGSEMNSTRWGGVAVESTRPAV